jgi:acetyl-CoA carboxylase/biotin carboxylase 1
MMSLKFADLHDTPGRMKEKKVIREVVPWRSARRYFYNRLRRRLAEEALCARIVRASPGITHEVALRTLHEWIAASTKEQALKDDARVADALALAVREGGWAQTRISELRGKWMIAEMMRMRGEDESAFQFALASLSVK